MTSQPKTDADSTPEFLLFVVRERLTDGSHVYNVLFGEMKFSAESEESALQLADEISTAINEHTVNTADVICEF